MYYGWNTVKVIHEERLQQMTHKKSLKPRIWRHSKVRDGVARFCSWILTLARLQKAKRGDCTAARKTQQVIVNHNTCT